MQVATTPSVFMARCIFINTFYDAFLQAFYRAQPQLLQSSYADQATALMAEDFGDSDFYAGGLNKAGWQAADLVVNCAPLQRAWAQENDCGQSDPLQIAVAQIAMHQPDVVYVQDLNATPRAFLEALKPHVKLIAGQIACRIVSDIPLDLYDVIFTSFPHYVERFRAAGVTAYYQPLAFAPHVLDVVANPAYRERQHALSFVGGLGALHTKASQLLDRLARETPIQFWGYGVESLPADSPIRPRHRGEAWGHEMFSLLGESQITVNRHVDSAENYANNMRLYEATGCGALLITDYKENLKDLFEIGEEVVAYRSHEECCQLIRYYGNHPEQAARIAAAGQRRTLDDHNYDTRMAHTAEVLERKLRYARESDRFAAVDAATVSAGHRTVEPGDVEERHLIAWKSDAIPARQRALVQQELIRMYRGDWPSLYGAATKALDTCLPPGSSLLEVGCASGYYYEILEYLMNRRIAYTGVDYSESLIEMARDYYPQACFEVADGAAMPFDDDSFDVVISNSVLLHVMEYADQVREAVRVARDTVAFLRTPVCRRGPTKHLVKQAYGIDTVELIFNEDELLQLFDDQGLELNGVLQYAADETSDSYHVNYVLTKRRPAEA
jgi:SAM-dependent methyltransferase